MVFPFPYTYLRVKTEDIPGRDPTITAVVSSNMVSTVMYLMLACALIPSRTILVVETMMTRKARL